MFKKFLGHLHVVNKHRFLVFINCCKCGIPFRGLVHDLSKYSFTEFSEGVRYFNGKRSPIGFCRRDKGYSLAWVHHKSKNKHHMEYWYDFDNPEQINMPYKYAVECVCDKIAASKTYKGKEYDDSEPYNYYFNRAADRKLHNERMVSFFATVFTDLREHGEKYVLNKKYMKKTYKEIVENNKRKGGN